MTARSKIRASLLLATLATAAAPGFAAETVEISRASTPYYIPADGNYYYVPATREYYVTPATTIYYEPITVYSQRATEDELITNDVVNEIANDSRLSGYVGVETQRNDVTLSGLVATPGQAERAARDARNVDGVRNVHNYLRARVGG